MKMDFYSMRLPYLIGVILFFILMVSGNIRRHKENFYLAFDRVHDNTIMIRAHVIATFLNMEMYDCVVKCILTPLCEAINLHQYSGKCETLNSSTLVTKDLLVRKSGCVFYETDPAKQNNGHYCEDYSPCSDTHICDDTYELSPLYTCRCEENFRGKRCDDYIGPGSNESVPAASCRLLKNKHKKLTNGFYWLRTSNISAEKRFCELSEGAGLSAKSAVPSCEWLVKKYPRYSTGEYWIFDDDQEDVAEKLCNMIWDVVNGNWGKWSTYTVCTESCGGGGTKTRTRRCDNPAPVTPLGTHCSKDKKDNETEEVECSTTPCDADGTSNVVNGVKYWVACYYHCKRTFESFVWGNGNFRYPFTCYCKSGTLTINSKPVGDIISGYTKDDVCGSALLKNNADGTILCNAGDQLQIEWASYGPEGIIHDCAIEKTDLIRDKCNMKQTCTFWVSKQVLNGGVDNCPNIHKFLAVQYKCKSANK